MIAETRTGRRKTDKTGTGISRTARKTILVVDDEVINRKLVEVILAAENSEIISVEDGVQALTCVADTPPDLILLDMMMPGMNGLEVLRRLKTNATTAEIPVIMVTAMTDRESVSQALDTGADECLFKPVNAAMLVLRVKNILNRHKPNTTIEKDTGSVPFGG
jgi:DNA-binding response OmpR family regulator